MDSEHEAPHIAISAQYIKDLSFENPKAPQSFFNDKEPIIDLSLELNISPLDEKDFFEVELEIRAKANVDDTTLYHIELKYAGIFHLINITQEQQQEILNVYCPNIIFPYARKIIADTTQSGKFQSLEIDPIDFGSFYYKKLSENTN